MNSPVAHRAVWISIALVTAIALIALPLLPGERPLESIAAVTCPPGYQPWAAAEAEERQVEALLGAEEEAEERAPAGKAEEGERER